MIHKNKGFFRSALRLSALVLLLSMMLVGCVETEEKRDFPAVNQNQDNESSQGKNTSKKTSQKTDKSTSRKTEESTQNKTGATTSKPNNSSGKKRVAITYDDGPHVERTKLIVDELAKYSFNATFFVVGNRVDGTKYSGGEAVKDAASRGNEIAIHAYTHDYYYDRCEASIYKSELSKTHSAILSKVPNANVNLMRPVGGNITAERVAQCDYAVIMWSVDSNDWKYKNDGEAGVEAIVDNVMSQVRDGSIILMHDIYQNTYLATQRILKELNNQGYDVVTVSELLGSPQAGVKYSKAS